MKKIDFSKIIENNFEEKIYKELQKKILEYVKINNNCSFWDIVRNVGGSERRLIRLLDQMVELKLLHIEDNQVSVKNGKKLLYTCPKCSDKLAFNDVFGSKNIETFINIYNNKPAPTFLFDQRPITFQTTINRALYMLKRMDVVEKDIVLLGDDDLTSIAIAILGLAKSITVLEIDKRLVDYINFVSKKYGFKIRAKVYNATTNLPNNLYEKFDTLLYDPTPEPIPFAVFTNTAIELCKKNATIYTSIYSSAMEFNYEMQRVIEKRGLQFTDMIPYWTEYKSIYNLYRDSDLDLFKKYGINLENGICFTETFIRMIKTNKTKTLKVKYDPKDLFGKATKRVLLDKRNDVEINSDKYLNDCLKNIKEEINE